MSKQTATIPINHSTDAAFRAWGSAISALFAAAGLTQTSDTGQINWSTVTRAAVNTTAGYEIWRLNDTAQATRPLFFKLWYGTANVSDRLWFQMDIGEGSNGSGTLTGATKGTAHYLYMLNSNAGTLDLKINWNPTTGYFCIFNDAHVSVSMYYYMCSLERLRTALGGPSTRGFACTFENNNGAQNCNYSTMVGGSFSTDTGNTIPLFWPGRFSGASSAGGTFVSGLTPLTGDGTHGPLEKTLGFMGVGSGDFPSGAQFSVTRWDGNLHTYLTCPTTGSANMNGNAMEGNCRGAVWWE